MRRRFDYQAEGLNGEARGLEREICSFEARLVSLSGSRLEVQSEHTAETSFQVAKEAMFICDGKISEPDSLKAGAKIRVTLQKGHPQTVSAIEWLIDTTNFPIRREIVRWATAPVSPVHRT